MNTQSVVKKRNFEPLQKKKHGVLSVSEKILKVQYENDMHRDKHGPEMELFFHELKENESRGKHFFNYFFAGFGMIFFALLYPFIALAIKISSPGPIITKLKTTGKSGRNFMRYEFRTKKISKEENTKPNYFGVGKVLMSTGLYKLPGVLNIFQGTLNVAGPMAYSTEESTYWNNIFDDFYKRYAVKPGLIAVYNLKYEKRTKKLVARQLKKEFRYIVSSKTTKDLSVLFGIFRSS